MGTKNRNPKKFSNTIDREPFL